MTFAVPKMLSAASAEAEKNVYALCMVVAAETPTRLLIRPRTPKRRAILFLKLSVMVKPKVTASTGTELVKTELFLALTQLKAARECLSLYSEQLTPPDNGRCSKSNELQESVNAIMNDVADLIGLDILTGLECQ